MTYNPSAGATPTVNTVTGLTAALAAKADTSTAVVTSDARLSDARTPTAHAYSSHTGLPTIGTAAASATTDFVAAAFTPTVSATSATTGTMTVTMGQGARTITPTGDCTFNASGGVAGQTCTFIISTTASSRTLTFGTNFRKAATLVTGSVNPRFFSVTFFCVNGTVWQEIARTAVLT